MGRPSDARKRVAVVDDDPVFAADIRILLQDRWDVMTTDSLSVAWQWLREDLAELFLVDIHLGEGERGTDLLDMMKHMHSAAPVVMMSDRPTVHTVVDAMKRGAAGFIPKTLEIREFERILEQALETRNDDGSIDSLTGRRGKR